jgi:hypothetical protein
VDRPEAGRGDAAGLQLRPRAGPQSGQLPDDDSGDVRCRPAAGQCADARTGDDGAAGGRDAGRTLRRARPARGRFPGGSRRGGAGGWGLQGHLGRGAGVTEDRAGRSGRAVGLVGAGRPAQRHPRDAALHPDAGGSGAALRALRAGGRFAARRAGRAGRRAGDGGRGVDGRAAAGGGRRGAGRSPTTPARTSSGAPPTWRICWTSAAS